MFASADDLGWQEKELAVALGYDPGYLSRIKSGEKPLPASRLAQLPKTLRRALWTLAAEQDGLIVAPEDVRKRALGQLLVAVGEVLQVFDERAPRATKLMAKANL
jgi:transcriptional regulator with XRE-family HTH domain